MKVYGAKVYDSRKEGTNYAYWTEDYLFILQDGNREERFVIRSGVDSIYQISLTDEHKAFKIEDMKDLSDCYVLEDFHLDSFDTNTSNFIKMTNIFEFKNPGCFEGSEFEKLEEKLGTKLAKYITVKRELEPENKFFRLDAKDLVLFKGYNSYFALEDFGEGVSKFERIERNLPKGIEGIGIVYKDEVDEEKTFVITERDDVGSHGRYTTYSIDSLDEIIQERINYGRKMQSFAAKAHIPWDLAKSFVKGTETKAEVKAIVEDIKLMKERIHSNYEIETMSRQIVGNDMVSKYRSATNKLIYAEIESFNNSIVNDLSKVINKEDLRGLISSIENVYMLENETVDKVFDKCIELGDKDSYKKLFAMIDKAYPIFEEIKEGKEVVQKVKTRYINNSALNYIFKEKESLNFKQIEEIGKTFASINNSTYYSKDEKVELKAIACKLIHSPVFYLNGKPKGFDNQKETLLRRAINFGMKFENIKSMAERFENIDYDVENPYKIFKNELNKKNEIEL